jgi:hypothetical protein
MRAVFPNFDNQLTGERETHRISRIHRLSRVEEASDLSKVTLIGSDVDGSSGTSVRDHHER